MPAADARADPRGARRDLDSTRSARVAYDGTYEDLFFYVERLIVARLRRRRRRPAAHRALPQRHRHDDVPDAAAGAGAGGARRRRCALRRVLLDARRAGTATTVFAAHTHTQPAQPTTIAHYLLAVVEQLERDTVRLQAAYASTNRNPLGACAITGTGFPIDRERTDRAARIRRRRPATPTAASRRSTTCSRACRRRRCCSSGSAASCRICCSGARASSAICGWRTASCSAAASCRRSATRSRSSTRARSASKAVGQAGGDHDRGPQHAVRRHRRHRGRSAAAGVRDVQGRRAARCRLVAAAMATARVRRRDAWPSAPAQGWITVTELADTLAREHGVPFKAEPRDRGDAGRRRRAPRPARRSTRCCATCRQAVLGRAIELHRRASSREILSPRHFVEVRTTPGGPAPSETARAMRRVGDAADRDEEWLQTRGRLAPRRSCEAAGETAAEAEAAARESAALGLPSSVEPSREPELHEPQIVITQCCPRSIGSSSSSRSTSAGP